MTRLSSLRRTAVALVAGATLAGIAFAGVAVADEPANVIKYRQNLMRAIAGHISDIAMVVKGEVSYTGHVATHARALHASAMLVRDVFPEGSGVGETRAKPEIWHEQDKFMAAVKALESTTGELARVAESGDLAAIGARLGDVGKACGGCHKPFRKEKQ